MLSTIFLIIELEVVMSSLGPKNNSKQRQSNIIGRNQHFFNFIFNSKTPKGQIQHIFLNPSLLQLHAISEIIFNVLRNSYIKLTPSIKKHIKDKHNLLIKFITNSKNYKIQRQILKTNFKTIFHILLKLKDIILQASDS